MTAREYLSQIEDLNECIKQDLRRKHDKLSMLKGIDYAADKVQTSPSSDQLCDQACSIVELDEKIEKEIVRYLNAREKIIEQIRGLHDVRYNRVLYGFYVECKGLKQMSSELKNSYSNVKQLRNEALDQFEKAYKGEMSYLY